MISLDLLRPPRLARESLTAALFLSSLVVGSLAGPLARPLPASPTIAAATVTPAGDAEAAYYRAFYLESALRRFDEAQATYAEASALATQVGARGLAARALAGHGRCLQALGRIDEARRAFENALALDPELAEARAGLDASARSAAGDGVDPELRLRIQALVQKLGGPERDDAQLDLGRVGDVAVPFLADGLRSRDVAVVEGAAKLLVDAATPAAIDALIGALDDDEVLFPRMLARGLGDPNAYPNDWEQYGRFARAGLRHEDPEIRRKFAGVTAYVASQWPALSGLAAMLDTIGADPDPAVFGALMNQQAAVTGAVRRDPSTAAARALAWARRAASSESTSTRRAAWHLCLSLSQLGVAADEVLLGLADDPEPEIRAGILQWAQDRAARGGAEETAEAFDLILRAMGDDPDQDVRRTAIERLRRMEAPWPAAVRDAAWAALREVLDGTASVSLRGAVLDLVVTSTEHETFTPAQLGEVFARLAGLSWLGERNVGGYQSGLAQRMLLRPKGEREPAFAFARAAFAAGDTDGRRALLEACRSQGLTLEPEIHALVLEAAASDDPTLRREAYAGLDDSMGLDLGRLPHLRDDIAGGSISAFLVLPEAPDPSFAPAIASLLDQVTRSGKWPLIVAKRYAAADPDGAFERLLPVLRATDTSPDGVSLRREMFSLLWEVDADAMVAHLLAGTLGIDVDGTLATRIPLEARERLARELPADRLTAQWMSHLWLVRPTLDPEAARALMGKGLQGTDGGLLLPALEIAETLAGPDDLPRIVELADAGPLDVRKAATETLAKIRARLEERAAIELFGPSGRVEALKRARAMAGGSDPTQRRAAALALGALGDPAAVPVLLDLVSDEDPEVRAAALAALERLGG